MRGKLAYWVAGLPVALRNASPPRSTSLDQLRHEYAARYLSKTDKSARRKRKVAMVLALPWVLAVATRFTALNGRTVRARFGRSIRGQFSDQIRVYLANGILPRWYYIFSLYEQGGLSRAPYFLNRFETKAVFFSLLNGLGSSPLSDKVGFAARCEAYKLPHVPVLASATGGSISGKPDRRWLDDLFIKPIAECGGKGAERWTWGGHDYRGPAGTTMSASQLLARLASESHDIPRLIQPRARNHPDIADLSNGALTTVRVLSCLDESGRPEVIGAVFRMAVGSNTTVDNFHAGGIAAAIALDTGELGCASNLGDDVSLGWLARHPDTKAPIEGRRLPMWLDVLALVERAHLAFSDRIIVGWDVAILADGPSLLEGNSGPDVDIMQRTLRRGLGQGRLPDLLIYNLIKSGEAKSASHCLEDVEQRPSSTLDRHHA